MRYRLRQFLDKCYGFDLLGYLLLAACVLLTMLARLSHVVFPSLIASIALVWAVSRAFSHNIHKRWAENQQLLKRLPNLRQSLTDGMARHRQRRDYKFFRCPGCRNRLRLPRGKGRIQITCPRCGQRFGGRT